MQGTVAALILLTSAIILSCLVVQYAVVAVQHTLQTTNLPQLNNIMDFQNSPLNQTSDIFNQTQIQLPDFPQP
jgi:hypothetical protein